MELGRRWHLRILSNARHFKAVWKDTPQAPGRTAEFLGIAIQSEHGLSWKHILDRAEKWQKVLEQLRLQGSEWTMKDVAKVIGIVIWDSIIRQRPLYKARQEIEVLRRGHKRFPCTTKRMWTITRHWETEEIVILLSALERVILNEPHIPRPPAASERCVWVASDASDEGFGFVFLNLSIAHVQSRWDSKQASWHIYVKEIFAATRAVEMIQEMFGEHTEIKLLMDNTAGLWAIEKRYSKNSLACELITRIDECQCKLILSWCASVDNPADEPSHLLAPTDEKMKRGRAILSGTFTYPHAGFRRRREENETPEMSLAQPFGELERTDE